MAYASAPSSKPHTSVTDPWSVTDYARMKLSPPHRALARDRPKQPSVQPADELAQQRKRKKLRVS